jgi:adenine C2-methylase RlmN of 23S rRNA A2503 and tRNA A37/adenylate kinase family enzyme
MKFGRNLTAGEIVSQVYEVSRQTKERITNVVLMGMGEPLMNYDNVLKALLILTDTKGYALPSRKITVSTVGFKNKIKKLADDITSPGNYALRKLKLALSLHTTDKGLREKLIPTAKLNPLSAIYEELIYFYKITGTKLTYEYIHFEGINDTPDEVKRLTKLSRMIPCNVNIIPFHTVSFELAEPLNKLNKKIHANIFDGNKNSLSKNKINDLIAVLRGNKVVVNLRSSSGADINAACGQLAVIKSKYNISMHQLIIFGPPGVGKGTQAELISEKLNLFHLSTGEYLRKAIAEETELGKKAKEIVEAGSLVPDDIMIGIVREALEKNITADCQSEGFILDGFPRTLEQAVALGKIFEQMNFNNVKVLHITVNGDEIVNRLLKRGRTDDTKETILHRLKVYETSSKKVIDHYKNNVSCVIEIDGTDKIEEINKKIHVLLRK